MARVRQFRFKSHHYAQMLSAFLFVLLFNFQNCARVKLQTASLTTPAKAKTAISKEVAVTNPDQK